MPDAPEVDRNLSLASRLIVETASVLAGTSIAGTLS